VVALEKNSNFRLDMQESPPLLKEDFLGEKNQSINVLDQNVNPIQPVLKNSLVGPPIEIQVAPFSLHCFHAQHSFTLCDKLIMAGVNESFWFKTGNCPRFDCQ
jgi:hypothetical protein